MEFGNSSVPIVQTILYFTCPLCDSILEYPDMKYYIPLWNPKYVRHWCSLPVAPIEGGWGPSPPQDFQNNINFIGFIDSMFNMYMHIKLQYFLVHELTSLGGADTGHLAWRRKKYLFLRHKNFCPPRNLWIGATVAYINCTQIIEKGPLTMNTELSFNL